MGNGSYISCDYSALPVEIRRRGKSTMKRLRNVNSNAKLLKQGELAKMEVESCLTAFNSGNTDESEFWREVSGDRVLTEVGDSDDIAD